MAKNRFDFKVSMIAPPGATPEDLRSFIEDAVACWAGQCRPDGWDGPDSKGDPMHRFDNKTLKVTRMRDATKMFVARVKDWVTGGQIVVFRDTKNGHCPISIKTVDYVAEGGGPERIEIGIRS